MLTLGQREAIAAEVWGPAEEVTVRSERIVYVQLVLSGFRVDGLPDELIERICAAAARVAAGKSE